MAKWVLIGVVSEISSSSMNEMWKMNCFKGSPPYKLLKPNEIYLRSGEILSARSALTEINPHENKRFKHKPPFLDGKREKNYFWNNDIKFQMNGC